MAEAEKKPERNWVQEATDALKAGNPEALVKISEDYRADRDLPHINPQIQKFAAQAIMEIDGYEVPEKIRTSTNDAVKALDDLKAKLSSMGALTPEAEKAIDAQKSEASKSFVSSDGIQKGWQAFVLDCIAEHFEKKKLAPVGKAIRGSQEKLVLHGTKRPMTDEEKAAYKKAHGKDTPKE